MSFFDKPILNSPYEEPTQHWELDQDGRPTDIKISSRRKSDLISAMPQPKSKRQQNQEQFDLSAEGLGTNGIDFNVTEFVNEIRREVEVWRKLPNPSQWLVSPITQRLLQHWRAIQKDYKPNNSAIFLPT